MVCSDLGLLLFKRGGDVVRVQVSPQEPWRWLLGYKLLNEQMVVGDKYRHRERNTERERKREREKEREREKYRERKRER